MILYFFLAFGPHADGRQKIVGADSVVPGEADLFAFIRDFGAKAGIGRYRRLDPDPDSPTHGQHLFERGTVSLQGQFV